MNKERLMHVLLGPHITEKATAVAEGKRRQIIFKVRTDAHKHEVKQAVEMLFNVTVENVRTVNMKGKTCRFGQRIGKHKDWKKAYVSLKEGDDINFSGVE